ncbi:MAG: 4Fe-4S dicluster domain-containing protein [Thermodesulfovibrionales bacterium]|nr:4Fe-4S dicluster domain-containing protein [Thermodesulfovibrionales bacterium]
MSINRREFIRIAGISTILGLGGSVIADKLGAASEVLPNEKALKGKHWGMAIDVGKLKTDADYRKCIDACHDIHNVPDIGNPKEEVKWIWTESYEHTFPGLESKFMSESVEHKPFMVLCNHCENPACARVCPTKATYKRNDGLVMQDMHRCIGCRFCMAACPFGARSFNWRDPRPFIKKEKENKEYPTRMKGVVEKCTFCFERLAKGLKPACVEASGGAIVFGDLEDPDSEIREVLRTRYTLRRKAELGTGPSIYYVIGGGEHA